jgi:hypothetical protein
MEILQKAFRKLIPNLVERFFVKIGPDPSLLLFWHHGRQPKSFVTEEF